MSSGVSFVLNPAWAGVLEHDTQALLEKIGQATEDAAKSVVPVDTGNLRDSISHEPASPTEVTVTASADYAAFVELGTEREAAQPYLRPALSMASQALS